MKKLSLILLIITIITGCSKSDNESTVKVDFIIENGNDDGVATIRVPGNDGSADGKIIGNGKSITGSYNYPKDFLMIVYYKTQTKVSNNFKMKVIINGSSKEVFYLSQALPQFTYVIEEKL